MSAALAMFRKGTRDGDIKKSAQKVSDHKKDAITRLKHLRHVLDNYTVAEAKVFFEINYSHIYYIFNDNFATVEADLKQRANKAHREELDSVLQVFERVLVLLPELVHKRWMFHSIGRVMKKLLHPGNMIKIRKDGMRLFLIWYQILQDNASEECHEIFLQLVPGLGDGIHQDALFGRVVPTVDNCSGMIAAGEITPILPSSGEKFPENVTKHFFDSLIYYMVSEVTKVEWMNTEMRRSSFVFLFDKFKSQYLSWLLPDFDRNQDIYNPLLESPTLRKMSELRTKDLPSNVAECRYSYIKWLAHFVLISKQQEQASEEEGCNAMAEAAVPEEDSQDLADQRSSTAERIPGSNASTLSTASHTSDQDSTTSSLCYEDFGDANEIVRSVLYSSRENINILHESFRQALLFTFRQGKAIKGVIGVYKDWFQHVDQLPIFMQEPSELAALTFGHRDTPEPEFHHSLSDIVEEENSSDESAPYSKELVRSLPSLENSDKYRIRNASYLGAIQDLADGGEHQNEIRAGIQKVLQVFIVNSAHVFLLDSDEEDLLSEQVDLCKKVLNIYRFLVMNIKMEQKTWEKMLEILLCVTSGVLSNVPNTDLKHRTLGGRLAAPVFQTVIVTWIKANLNVLISAELWDRFQQVLSSLTAWPELIKEWAKAMETLTRVLAKQVYNLDLHDLPLQRLSEHKEIRRRGRSQDIPKNKINDKSFSRGWSKSESHGGGLEKTMSLTGASVPFERGKYKSDGAGGSKTRPELSKQRSLSGEPSPSHSRQPSNASDSALYVRRSSDGADPEVLKERLKGITLPIERKVDSPIPSACPSISISNTSDAIVDASGPEDIEVSKITMTSLETSLHSAAAHDGYMCMDYSGDGASLDKSDQENTFRYSRTPSPSPMHSRSPSPTSEVTVNFSVKDCPTPDQDSLHIDMVASDEAPISKESTEDLKSVLAGGTVQGWMPDNAVVLWRRMLGSLGNINKIDDAENHATVHEELNYLLETLNKIRKNLSVTVDNNSTPAPPEFIPPIYTFSPWLFECLTLSNKYKRGKLLAYQLLCQMIVQRHDLMLPSELLSQFYLTLHQGLCSNDQDIINTLVRYCGSGFFSTLLSGSTLLIKDMIAAAGAVISAVDLTETPRTEAMAILGSLVCFPNHYSEIQVLEHTGLSISYLYCNDFKEMVLSHLLRAGKKEPAGLARCVSLNSLGVFLYEELAHNTLHPKLNEAFIVLLGALRCKNRQVAKVSSDVLSMLSDHADKLLSYHPQLPKLIIEVVAATISILIPPTGCAASDEEKKLIVSMMFCMVEWCMKMPVSLLLETSDTERGTLYNVFSVLNISVKGHTVDSLNAARQVLSGMIQDSDFEYLQDMTSSHRRSSSDSMIHTMTDHFSDKPKQEEKYSVSLAAKLLINHLVNHYCHFPMGAGASTLSSSIQENHDQEDPMEDLKPDIFYATNIQFFVQNRRTLVSLIELPALLDLPGGGVTAGLTTARTVCRVILRDLTGKYSWESAVLFAPPWCQQGSSLHNAKALLELSADDDLERLIIEEDTHQGEVVTPLCQREAAVLPTFENAMPQQDNLDHMLRFIGHTSPECLLIPGEPLNIEAPIPEGLSELTEEALKEMVTQQKHDELDYYSGHKNSKSMLAQPQMPTEVQESASPFQMCRMMLDQMGLLAWEKRCHFDLLKKSDKLLRELKNLDSQKCRETHKFAVIYVAEGQEDKNSILSNCGGSKAFEDFVAGLGWEVELEMHQGFMGGLQQNKTTGDTAPYYATSLMECIFHVSTRMPSGTDEGRHIKMRHLGNDEVHIIWSEHTRDYRRGIIPTEFGDVLIIIYPLPSGLYRVQINRKPEVPYFGPLFDGAILDRKVLPGLVRATAINASRVKRLSMTYYHSFYEERAKYFENITQQHIDFSMFEDFAAKIFAPILPQNSTISDNSTEIHHSSSSSSLDYSQQNPEQMSPSSGRQSRGRKVQSAIWHKGRDSLLFY